jgi:hypothetical protein
MNDKPAGKDGEDAAKAGGGWLGFLGGKGKPKK